MAVIRNKKPAKLLGDFRIKCPVISESLFPPFSQEPEFPRHVTRLTPCRVAKGCMKSVTGYYRYLREG